MVNVGIVGAGYAGSIHAETLNKNKRVKIIAVSDCNRGAARSLAARFGAKTYVSHQDLTSDRDVEAVFITSPNAYHAEQAVQALENGKHVFCEKPMATSLEGAGDIVRAVEKSGMKYQIGHSRCFWPVYKKIKELIEMGELTPYVADAKMVRGELKNPSWVADPKISGGFLYESTINMLYLLRWFLGDVTEVWSLARSNLYKDQLDDFVISLQFRDGGIASVNSSAHASWTSPFERVEIFGDHSCAMTEEAVRITYCPGLNKEIVIHDFSQLARLESWGFVEEDKEFINALVEDREVAVDLHEGYKAVELVEACYRSAKLGKPVSLPL